MLPIQKTRTLPYWKGMWTCGHCGLHLDRSLCRLRSRVWENNSEQPLGHLFIVMQLWCNWQLHWSWPATSCQSLLGCHFLQAPCSQSSATAVSNVVHYSMYCNYYRLFSDQLLSKWSGMCPSQVIFWFQWGAFHWCWLWPKCCSQQQSATGMGYRRYGADHLFLELVLSSIWVVSCYLS